MLRIFKSRKDIMNRMKNRFYFSGIHSAEDFDQRWPSTHGLLLAEILARTLGHVSSLLFTKSIKVNCLVFISNLLVRNILFRKININIKY